MPEERLRLDWYTRRLSTNKRIKDMLISKIEEHQPGFPIHFTDLQMLNYENLLEIAIGCVNEDISITLGKGKDYCDSSDAKMVISQSRNNNVAYGNWMHSIVISNCKNKEGPLRVCAYNQLLDDFHYFYIPHNAYSHLSRIEIIIERAGGEYGDPEFTGKPALHRKWWNYRCTSFEQMCLLDHETFKKKEMNDSIFNSLFEYCA